VFPYLALYFAAHGLRGDQIGLLMALTYFLAPVAGPLAGAVADMTRRPRLLLTVLLAGLMATSACIWRFPWFHALLGLIVGYALCDGPMAPIADNATLEALGRERRRYGRQRLFGSVAWGAASPAIGWAIDRWGLGTGFVASLALLALAMAAATRMPPARGTAMQGHFWRDARLFMRNRRWLHFLVAVFFGGLALSLLNVYLFLHMQSLGANRLMMGYSQVFSTSSELLVLLFFDRLARLGPRRIFMASMTLLVVRLALLSYARDPFWVLMLQLTHGATYATMMASGVLYAQSNAPRGLGTTAQGVFSGVFIGLGGGVGTIVGGNLYRHLGTALMYRWGAAILAGGLALCVVMGLAIPGMRPSRKPGPPQANAAR
jgi:PPP family 3-phenylpropionic acid transporter